MDIHSSFNAILQFIFSIWNNVVFLYLGGGLFSYVFGIWIFRKVSRLFDYIAH